MVSVDFRTRSDADVRPVEAASFFGEELPELIERNVHLALAGAEEMDPRPLAFEVEGRSWTLALAEGTVTVTPGQASGSAVARLDPEGLTDLVHDVRTPVGFLTGGDLDMERGRLEDLLDWWVVLRSLLDAREVHTRGSVEFRGPEGEPLDLARSFSLEDPAEEMAAFLAEAGFLHIRRAFSEREMAQVSAEIDEALPSYRPDDGRSWWARTAGGDQRAVRLQRFQEVSPTTAGILGDDRLLSLGSLTADGHRLSETRVRANLIEALVKPIGIVEGISDLPWHKDCSLGRHSYTCCSLTVGISVTGADAHSGQLRVVAGSHRALIQPAFIRRGLDLPRVDLPTQTGDVTVHLSCTLHMSQPPESRERRVLYTGFRLPDDSLGGENEAKISRIREGAYKTVSQKPALR